ncbi:Ubiquinol cytochrome-c reductase assembly protein Cbp3 [Coemansia sp. RSA 2559]|nr:Ubiquinol cytochrome-c reductase assembly protein Cbp3 [Coemansia sp. RSA 2559]KAJ2859417.1 Ubiquinol cytochrome-c reductase assembly protein Cbp3 [Coemansia erecta]
MFKIQNQAIGALRRSTDVLRGYRSIRRTYNHIITAAPLKGESALRQVQYSSTAKGSNATTKAATAPVGPRMLSEKYANIVRKILAPFLPHYRAQNIGTSIYQICSTCPGYTEFWIGECQLPDTFQTWFSIMSLYTWMMMVRIRADPNAKHYNQGLIDCFFGDAEHRIRKSGVTSGRIVNDTLKDLVSSFKGTVMSLDQGFATSDAVLAAAIWRNVLPADGMVLQIDQITGFVRSQLAALDKCSVDDLIAKKFAFQSVRS